MILDLTIARLRKPEPSDLEPLYLQKNDPEVTALLGGPPKSYSRAGIARWIEHHGGANDELLFAIADADDACLGHVGLYRIDHRARSAEFAIMIGARTAWGKGIGKAATTAMLRHGFEELQLHRIYLDVLAVNERAVRLYESIGFLHEGRLRDAQWKGDRFHDVLVMSMLEDAWRRRYGRA